MNTISRPMLQLLSELLLKADADPAVRCVILTGAGRAFCAGLDVRAQAKGTGMLRTDTAPRTSIDLRNSPPTVLHAMEKPVICAVNGGAAGYGMDLAIGSDMDHGALGQARRRLLQARGAASNPAAPGICRGA